MHLLNNTSYDFMLSRSMEPTREGGISAPTDTPEEDTAMPTAEPLYKRSLAIKEKALGSEHSDVAQNLENYATLLRKTNRDAEATRTEARATAIRAKCT